MREAQRPAWTDWLVENGVVALDGIDTRSLVLHLRDRGAMRAARSARAEDDRPRSEGGDGGRRRSSPASPRPSRTRYAEVGRVDVAVVDYGTKKSILRRLAGSGAAVTVYPHTVDADTLAGYDGVVLSNGPGDPTRSSRRPRSSGSLLGRTPVFGICLGHQLLGLATGHETFKLPFGHRGANHPVLGARRGRVLVTSQNHGFAVDADRGLRGDGDLALRRHGRGVRLPRPARAVGAVPSGGGPGPARRLAVSLEWVEELAAPETDIESICLIGSGPIVIGQACEFDYAGCQALKVLREDGFRTIVVNSNPATIMTDPGFADRTYLEPLDLEGVADVLERERPDALLPTLGGQTALNLSMQLAEAGVLDTLGVELIGAGIDAIKRAEDRELFRDLVIWVVVPPSAAPGLLPIVSVTGSADPVTTLLKPSRSTT